MNEPKSQLRRMSIREIFEGPAGKPLVVLATEDIDGGEQEIRVYEVNRDPMPPRLAS